MGPADREIRLTEIFAPKHQVGDIEKAKTGPVALALAQEELFMLFQHDIQIPLGNARPHLLRGGFRLLLFLGQTRSPKAAGRGGLQYFINRRGI